jgi:hypothetical protein
MEETNLGAGARLSVFWQAGQPEHPIDTVDHVASYTRALAEALTMGGWKPRWLEVGLRAVPPKVVEIDVRGEVPRLDQANFAKLASVAIAACNLWAALDDDAEIRLRPRLVQSAPVPLAVEPAPGAAAAALITGDPAPPPKGPRARLGPPAATPAEPAPPPTAEPPPPAIAELAPLPTAAATTMQPSKADRPRLITRVLVALAFGGLLGLFGLPRLVPQFELPTIPPAVKPTAVVFPTQDAQETFQLPTLEPPPVLARPTPPPAPTPTRAPTPASEPLAEDTRPNATLVPTPQSAAVSRVLFAERFVEPLPGWPHEPNGSAWFADGTYQMAAREPGRFVAVSVPLAALVSDVNVSARFRKTGGPAGGGYGLVVRNQAAAPLDGETQLGRYIVFEVGDMGDIGIWQRDEARWIDVLPWTHADAVRAGVEPNELVVSTQGNRLRFIVNGVEVASMTRADLPPEGGVGVFVGGDMNEVNLEWLIVEAMGPFLALR